jgi:hypothetical protein
MHWPGTWLKTTGGRINPAPRFTMKLIARHSNNLEKAIMEGLVIEKQDRNFLLNKKGEWRKNI